MKNNTTTLDKFIETEVGPLGSEKRDVFEAGYEGFKIGVLIKEARKKKHLTQEQLAEKIGIKKSYISKLENDAHDIRFSTLQSIAKALGVKLEVRLN